MLMGYAHARDKPDALVLNSHYAAFSELSPKSSQQEFYDAVEEHNGLSSPVSSSVNSVDLKSFIRYTSSSVNSAPMNYITNENGSNAATTANNASTTFKAEDILTTADPELPKYVYSMDFANNTNSFLKDVKEEEQPKDRRASAYLGTPKTQVLDTKHNTENNPFLNYSTISSKDKETLDKLIFPHEEKPQTRATNMMKKTSKMNSAMDATNINYLHDSNHTTNAFKTDKDSESPAHESMTMNKVFTVNFNSGTSIHDKQGMEKSRLAKPQSTTDVFDGIVSPKMVPIVINTTNSSPKSNQKHNISGPKKTKLNNRASTLIKQKKKLSSIESNNFQQELLCRNTNLNKHLRDIAADNQLTEKETIEKYNHIFFKDSFASKSIENFEGSISPEDGFMPFSPIYKKTGELVKSVLKRRSKSLPVTPNSRDTITAIGKTLQPSLDLITVDVNLKRSKSVHFDQRLPIKHYFIDESPLDITKYTEVSDVLSFQPKPLNKFVRPDTLVNGDSDFIPFWLDRAAKKNKFALDQLEVGYSEEYTDLNRDAEALNQGMSTLFIRNKNQSSLSKNFMSSDRMPQRKNDCQLRLCNRNFPVLSYQNSTSLTLNIFSFSSAEKYVFLQELTGKIHHSELATESIFKSGYRDPLKRIIMVGKILVKNIHFDKKVVVRYTWDNWRTVKDAEAFYLANGDSFLPGSKLDVFKFVIDKDLCDGSKDRIQFCISYVTRDESEKLEFWDNNYGQNYIVDVLMNENSSVQ